MAEQQARCGEGGREGRREEGGISPAKQQRLELVLLPEIRRGKVRLGKVQPFGWQGYL